MGLTGIYSTHSTDEQKKRTLEELPSFLDREYREFLRVVHGFGAKLFEFEFMNPPPQPFVSPDKRYLAFAIGDIYNVPEKKPDLQSVFDYFLEKGFEGFERVNGRFVFAVFDTLEKKLHLANDRLGSQPLYYLRQSDELFFSTSIRSLFEAYPGPRELDHRGIAEIMLFCHHFGDSTLFDKVRCLPAASILSFEGSQLSVEPYWRIIYRPDPSVRAEDLAAMIRQAVSRVCTGGGVKGLLLSGGLDSRVVAHEAVRFDPSLQAFTFGKSHSMDVSYAEQVSSRLEINLHRFDFDPLLWAKNLPEVARQAEGEADIRHYKSIQFHDRLAFLCETILTGMSGDMIMGSFIKKEHLADMSWSSIRDYVFRSSLEHPVELLAGLFQKGKWERLYESCRELVTDTIKHNPNEKTADILNSWNLENRQRRFILMGPATNRYRFNGRSPFYEYDLFDTSLRIPLSQRLYERLYIKALWMMMPTLRDIPWQKTGLTADPRFLPRGGRKMKRATVNKIKRDRKSLDKNFMDQATLIRQGFSPEELKRIIVTGERQWHQVISSKAVENIIDEHFRQAFDHSTLITKFLTLSYTEELLLGND